MATIIEQIAEIDTEKLVTLVIATVIVIFLLLVTTCSIHMNTYNAGDAKIATIEAKAQSELVRQQHEANMEQIKVVENLIKDSGADPLAARCAVEGWKGSNTMTSVCREIAERIAIPTEVK